MFLSTISEKGKNMIKYPNGGPSIKTDRSNKNKTSNRTNLGMNLEKDVEISSKYFIDHNQAIFYKKPTPIHVYKISHDNSHQITEAYYDKKSTTDYNGLYREKYIDFECKETKTKTLPIDRLSKHQVEHLYRVKRLGGIAFFLVRFNTLDETYIFDIDHVIDFIKLNDKQSFSYNDIKTKGYLVTKSYSPRLELLKGLDEAYFSDEDKQEEDY